MSVAPGGTVGEVNERTAVIRAESAVVQAVAAAGPLDAAVPSCPEWNLGDLVRHLGAVQRFWAANVAARRPDGPVGREAADPVPDAEIARWFGAGTELLVTALEDAGPSSPCWTWWGDPRTSGAVARHQVQEAAVHRWDAQSAVGTADPLDPDVAVDGVAEFLQVMIDHRPATGPGTVTFVATDTGTSWRVGPDMGPALTVEATASDLVLLLYRRLPVTAVGLQGDTGVLDDFFATYDCE